MNEIKEKISLNLQKYFDIYNNQYLRIEDLVEYLDLELKNFDEESGIKILDKSNKFAKDDGIYLYLKPEYHLLILNNSKIKKIKINEEDFIKSISLCLFIRMISFEKFVEKELIINLTSEIIDILKKYNI